MAGTLAGLLGVGGGIVIVPIMSIVLDIIGAPNDTSMHVAVATSMATIVVTSIASTNAHHKRGSVDTSIVKTWAPFIIFGALAGAIIAQWISSDALRILFTLFVFGLGAKLALGASKTQALRSFAPSTQRVGALFIGTLSAWMGIGGGSLSVPFMRSQGIDIHRAVGTSAAIGFVIALPAAIGYVISGYSNPNLPVHSLGYLHIPSIAVLLPTTLLFAPLGAKLAHRLPAKTLQLIFATFLLLAGTRMLFKVMSS